MILKPYDAAAAVAYAHRWAFGRNPAYYDFELLGGDCTNFASQCLYAGSGVMNFTPTFGWFYRSAGDRTPSWTGVPFFYDFLTRRAVTLGPVAEEVDISRVRPGDFVQLDFGGGRFGHTPVVVSAGERPSPGNLLLAAHTYDTDYRPLSTYVYRAVRFLHITGVWAQN